MQIGLVKWFDESKGFGVVVTPKNEELFLHINSFTERPAKILKGTPIIFSKHFDKKKEKYAAENSRLVGFLEDWGISLSYLGKSDEVPIEVEVKGHSRHGNPYVRKEIRYFNLNAISTRKILEGKTVEEIFNVITEYFDHHLQPEYFINYCELIENRINKIVDKNDAEELLNKIWQHFGSHLKEEILFRTWITRKFKFIGYSDATEYQIPLLVFKKFVSEIGLPELKRIKEFENGELVCKELVNDRLNNIELLTSNQLKLLYPFLDFLPEPESKERKAYIDKLYISTLFKEIINDATSLDAIATNNDFEKYASLKNRIPAFIDDTQKSNLIDSLNAIIITKSLDSYRPELWLKGLINDISFELLSDWFLSNSISIEKSSTILSRMSETQQFELLTAYSKKYGWEKGFDLLEHYLKSVNSLRYDFELSDKLFDIEYWSNKKSKGLLSFYNKYVFDHSSDEEKYSLFFKGFINKIPQDLVLQNATKLNYDESLILFERYKETKEFILQILIAQVFEANIPKIELIYQLAYKFLGVDQYHELDLVVLKAVTEDEYFSLWKKGKGKILPREAISKFLSDNYDSYNVVDKWLGDNIITAEHLSEFLIELLKNEKPIEDRIGFYRLFNRIKCLLKIDKTSALAIRKLNNTFFNLILWFLTDSEELNFDELKFKFIYFAPNDQIKIVKRLFSCKAKNEFDLTIEKLDELRRFDFDLYNLNLEFNPELQVDISTDVVIKALLSYRKSGRFLFEGELLKTVLDDLGNDKTKRFSLHSFFEKCKGRTISKFNWNREGEVSKIQFGNNQFYFAITFPTGENVWINGRDRFQHNPNFERLKEAVKGLPGSKWNAAAQHWGVPSQYESQVLDFARDNRFFLNIGGGSYSDNIHLAEFPVVEIPNGISFCEGRIANRLHQTFKKEFWWCKGQACFEKCENIHGTDEWDNYTLLDFCEILRFNTDETNRMGDFIPKGVYYQFIGLINRFNRLLERLYCTDCNQILSPVDTSHFAAHTVVRFHCVNAACHNKQEIYLNHCLNGQCNSIIDSRVSKKCTNGLYICENCGSCCSHSMLERRLNGLRTTNGYIHSSLVYEVERKLGHLERAEYYCFRCGEEMDETDSEVFHCNSCDVTYDTKKYNLKRPHRHLKNANSANNPGTGDNNDDSPGQHDVFI
jgi:cold shock CspA family protein